MGAGYRPWTTIARAQSTLGAMLNLNGKRSLAEETFKQSIAKDPTDVWNSITMAGSYLGVRPD